MPKEAVKREQKCRSGGTVQSYAGKVFTHEVSVRVERRRCPGVAAQIVGQTLTLAQSNGSRFPSVHVKRVEIYWEP
jgi:hypothetical protein